MSVPEALQGDPCSLAARWRISLDLATKLFRGSEILQQAGLGIPVIISGYRTVDEQEALRASGRPTAPPGRSTHTVCPATGADLWLSSASESQGAKLAFVTTFESVGLRVGGGSPLDPSNLPTDWNHVDLGPLP